MEVALLRHLNARAQGQDFDPMITVATALYIYITHRRTYIGDENKKRFVKSPQPPRGADRG
jgi:hypothetical protein